MKTLGLFAALMLLTTSWAMAGALVEDAGPAGGAPSVGLVISEMTIDAPPGAEGSWIELYNPGAESLQVENTTVVYNGREVYRMPQLSVPPKTLVLVRFSKEIPEREREWERRKKENPKLPPQPWWRISISGNACKFWALPVFEWKCPRQREERKPGYCAVFRSPDLREENLLDLAFWGTSWKKEGVDTTYRTWAEKQGLWPSTKTTIQVYTGPDLFIGAWVPAFPGVLARMDFSKELHRGDAWIVYGEHAATPGAGNRWPAPWLGSPSSGVYLAPTDPLYVSWETFIPIRLLEKESRPARFQVARDPHFQDVVMDIRVAPHTLLEDVDLEPGKYYARIKCEAGPISTDWSETEFFEYHLPRPGTQPAPKGR